MNVLVKTILVSTLLLAGLNGHAQKSKKKKKKGKKMELKTELDSVSYSIGVNIANQLKAQGVEELNVDAFAAALNDVFDGEAKIDDQQAQSILQDYFTKQKAKQDEATKAAGEAFLAENAKREGVTTLPSGLQYEVMVAGDGPKPTATSRVKTHYHGTLVDGTVFDSSVERNQPATFGVNQVIKGWTEALQLMPVGSKWKLFIPYDLAYGANPRPGGPIKPYDALIFEVELISIEQ
jgi:FKBP-type peptidyl-prolyl cis-trans isomerase FklB